MDIVVCVKQVPDTNEVKIDPEEGTLIREGVPSIINPEDKNGIEEALKLKEEFGGTVTVLSMGPPQAEKALKEALAMGADEAILLSDKAFAGSDTLATSYILSCAIEQLDDFDMIFCGRQAIDGDTAQVGSQIAENLGIPQVTYVEDVKVEDNTVEVKRRLEDGYSVLETSLPVLLTVLGEVNEPRYPSIKGIVDAHSGETEVKKWGANKLGDVDQSKFGLSGSPTQVHDTFVPTHEKKAEILSGTPEEKAHKLIDKLKEEKVVSK
ncbi:electron transfer flavoprotein subunit beta/FixA family protein [Halanaerobacter jeridensis]|uniref:Electron transfer flavoprotein small subunit n=1 Tax=Halanaerobacter jeridensis TaxID=706427 RepID=A0A938XSR3_9FIRM|nr:electron transfer flavoprotein subunit beta/FixA family protein [Halanaerobacter jeridensis]MBM7556818.1 electron transfer flavoprotein beta subunit [Halanaerobacter jeridensis]